MLTAKLKKRPMLKAAVTKPYQGKGYAEGYEEGKEAEYDRFWDMYQANGTREKHLGAFSTVWNDENFVPKYDICPTDASYMFFGSSITDLVALLERRGRKIDFSRCTGFQWMTRESQITHFPTIDLIAANNFNDGFRYLSTLEQAEFTNVKPVVQWSNSFANNLALKEIRFQGQIGKAINFANSSKLSAESIQSIIDALADLSGATAQTLTLHKTVGAKLTDAQKAAIAAKNWNLVY